MRRTVCIVTGIAVLASATMVTLNHWKRPHAVIEGEAYRSAQLATPDLAAFARSAGLKSVLSLRSRNTTDERHQQEIEWCARNGLVHRQVPLTPTQVPSPAQLKALIHELLTMPKPMLIHCEKGADRTGLASAIFLILQTDCTVEQALAAQLCLAEGHFGWGREAAMEQTFLVHEQLGSSSRMRDWLRTGVPGKAAADEERAGELTPHARTAVGLAVGSAERR